MYRCGDGGKKKIRCQDWEKFEQTTCKVNKWNESNQLALTTTSLSSSSVPALDREQRSRWRETYLTSSSSSSSLSLPTLDREWRPRRRRLGAFLTSLSSTSLPVLDCEGQSWPRGPRCGWCCQEKLKSIFHEKIYVSTSSKQTKKNTYIVTKHLHHKHFIVFNSSLRMLFSSLRARSAESISWRLTSISNFLSFAMHNKREFIVPSSSSQTPGFRFFLEPVLTICASPDNVDAVCLWWPVLVVLVAAEAEIEVLDERRTSLRLRSWNCCSCRSSNEKG